MNKPEKSINEFKEHRSTDEKWTNWYLWHLWKFRSWCNLSSDFLQLYVYVIIVRQYIISLRKSLNKLRKVLSYEIQASQMNFYNIHIVNNIHLQLTCHIHIYNWLVTFCNVFCTKIQRFVINDVHTRLYLGYRPTIVLHDGWTCFLWLCAFKLLKIWRIQQLCEKNFSNCYYKSSI